MSLKEKLIKLKNKIKTVDIEHESKEANCIYPISEEDLNNILINAINNFFPKTGRWTSECFKKPNETIQSNLRNNELLAKMIQKSANLPDKYYSQVLNYINSSDLFKQKVHEYEQEIVKWQINFMKRGGEGWVCDPKLGGDFCLSMPSCDIAFRKGVVDTLSAIGMDEEAIEEGIEKNADMWRNHYMERAFSNKYEPEVINLFRPEGAEPLPYADINHRKAWIKMRKYEYYCKHKISVDLYGVVEPEMILKNEEYYELMTYLEIENSKRLELIEEYKKENNKRKKLVRENNK